MFKKSLFSLFALTTFSGLLPAAHADTMMHVQQATGQTVKSEKEAAGLLSVNVIGLLLPNNQYLPKALNYVDNALKAAAGQNLYYKNVVNEDDLYSRKFVTGRQIRENIFIRLVRSTGTPIQMQFATGTVFKTLPAKGQEIFVRNGQLTGLARAYDFSYAISAEAPTKEKPNLIPVTLKTSVGTQLNGGPVDENIYKQAIENGESYFFYLKPKVRPDYKAPVKVFVFVVTPLKHVKSK